MAKHLKHFMVVTLLIFASTRIFAADRGIANTSAGPYVKLRSVDIDDVKWTDGFWARKFDLCHKVMNCPYHADAQRVVQEKLIIEL